MSQSQAPCLTAAELALGAVAQPLPPSSEFERVTHGGYGRPPGLSKSRMVAKAVRRVQEEARAYNPEPAPASVLGSPGAIHSAKLARPGKSLFRKGVPLSHSAIPSATPRLSQDDTLLIPERSQLSKSPHLASIPEGYLVDSEEMARRGMETTSVMDSFLGGWVGVLRYPDSDSFQLRQHLDAPAVLPGIQTLEQGSRPLLTSSPCCIRILSGPGGIRPCQPLRWRAQPLCAPPFAHCL